MQVLLFGLQTPNRNGSPSVEACTKVNNFPSHDIAPQRCSHLPMGSYLVSNLHTALAEGPPRDSILPILTDGFWRTG